MYYIFGGNMTTNKITTILNSISDADLKIAIGEIKSLNETGILWGEDNVVRKLGQKIRDEIGVELHYALSLAEKGVLETAAFKWFDSTQKVVKDANVELASLATGANLTADTFNDFVSRLNYHSRGEGVNDHCTADALFLVEARCIVSGIDSEYTDNKMVIFDGDSYMTPTDYWHSCDAAAKRHLNKCATDENQTSFRKSPIHIQWNILGHLEDHTVTGWKEQWEFVNAHFTKEAAEAFIARKKHDYPEGIRIYVDAQTHCWEFNTIKAGLMNGKIVFAA
jgi:hypothetical protein